MRGVFMMARYADMPIAPIAVRGIHDVNSKGTFLFHPGKTIDVFVGPQYETGGLSEQEIGDLADAIRDHMVRTIEQGDWPSEDAVTSAARSRPRTSW